MKNNQLIGEMQKVIRKLLRKLENFLNRHKELEVQLQSVTYGIIRLQKIIDAINKENEESRGNLSIQDTASSYNHCIDIINQFKTTAFSLDRKVNVLINQLQKKHHKPYTQFVKPKTALIFQNKAINEKGFQSFQASQRNSPNRQPQQACSQRKHEIFRQVHDWKANKSKEKMRDKKSQVRAKEPQHQALNETPYAGLKQQQQKISQIDEEIRQILQHIKHCQRNQ